MEGVNGGTLNVGGTFPGAGRPTKVWQEECERLALAGLAPAAKIVANAQHPAFVPTWKHVSEQAYGKAVQRVDIAASALVLDASDRDARLLALVARLLPAADVPALEQGIAPNVTETP